VSLFGLCTAQQSPVCAPAAKKHFLDCRIHSPLGHDIALRKFNLKLRSGASAL
jgi:hypothetical protein